MHPLNGALPVPYVPVRVTRGALVAHQFTYALPRCRTMQYRRTFILLSVSLWNDLANLVFDGVGLASFKGRANAFLLAYSIPPGGSEWIISVGDYVTNSFTALGSTDPREVRLEL